MKAKGQPKFKVWDVVEGKSGSRGIIWTTEKTEALIQADSLFSEAYAREHGRDDFFAIDWFNGEQHTGFISEDDLTLCKGVEDSNICGECEYRFKCWTNRK